MRALTVVTACILFLSTGACSDEPAVAAPVPDAGPAADILAPVPDSEPRPADAAPPVVEAGATSGCNESHPDRTVGLISCTSQAEVGYTLLAPQNTNVYLLDLHGRVVHTWKTSSSPGQMVSLMNDGRLLHPSDNGGEAVNQAGGQGGLVEIIGIDGTTQWTYDYCRAGSHCQHHDVASMPNGNVLMVAWERKSRAEALAAGMSLARLGTMREVWVDHVVELKPQG